MGTTVTCCSRCDHNSTQELQEGGDADEKEPGELGLIIFNKADYPEEVQPHAELLEVLLAKRSYLKKPEHSLFYYVEMCTEAIGRGNPDDAQTALDSLTMRLDGEERMIAAAFVKFDTDGSGVLHGDEIGFMLDYLGFPDSPADVEKLLKVIDSDGDKSVSLDEFVAYVGKLGGSTKLFEVRRQQIKDRVEFKSSVHDPEHLRLQLQESGMSPEAQAAWSLVASESELDSVAHLTPCQRKALYHIRTLAEENHARALPGLQKRFEKLGKPATDLWMCLAWIRELAPILIHINLDKVGEFLLKDTHYRNQFETKTSQGLLNAAARKKWEKGLFGTAYEAAEPFERPKYGVQNIWNDHRGVLGAKQYGDSYMVLKDVRLRCTLSPEDSANMPARKLSVLDYYAHVLQEYSDKELLETIRVASKGREKVGDSSAVIEKWGKYKEAQIHGEVHLDHHVTQLVVAERHRPKADWVEKICKAHSWTLTWMDEMKGHLESRAGGRELTEAEWHAKLSKLGRVGSMPMDEKPDWEKVYARKPVATKLTRDLPLLSSHN